MRGALLGAADSHSLQRLMYRHGMRLGARRFVAGETLNEFLLAARSLNEKGFSVACGLLGEGVHDPQAASAVTREYQDILDQIASNNLRSNIALKLTHLGLAIDKGLALANLSSIVQHAARLGNFVRIDMEQSAFTDATLTIYRALRDADLYNSGTVLQAYLYRSEEDLRSMLPLQPNLRLVKGAYLEPASIAFASKTDVDANYRRLIELALLEGGFTAIATHDERIIEHSIGIIEKHSIPSDRYEFQMLYGVRPTLQASLLERGFRVRLAVPFGSQWYPYLMRRLAERPANLFFFVGSLLRS